MNPPAIVFSVVTNAVLLVWLLLVFFPAWRWTQRLVHAAPAVTLLCVVYAVLQIIRPEAPPGASLTSLEGYVIGSSSPWGALVTWVHILAIDLFTGLWILRDARRLAIPHLWVAPCLVATFILAPIGLLTYFVLRLIFARALSLDEVRR